MARLRSLRSKLTRTMLLICALIGVSALGFVVFTSAQASSQHLALVQKYIEQGISSKGRVLTENHALALRGLTLDNAFLDMQRLVERAVADDVDVVYGLYVNVDGRGLAYAQRGAAETKQLNTDDKAWRSLELTDSELLVSSPQIRRTHRLGQDLLEVAIPVRGEDSELLGAVRYGFSTRRMHDALAQAEAVENARLKRSLWLLGSLIAFSTLLVALLSRLQATRITRPVDALTLAAERLAAGNRGVRVEIRSGDEIERLGASFNHMVEDLDQSYRKLEEMNHTLEQKVEQRTLELASMNRDMRLVLDNVDQGFVTLSMDGTMTLERSRVIDEWFGSYDKALRFDQYISAVSSAFGVQFGLAWDQVIEDFLPLDAGLAQLPVRLSVGSRTWTFRYLPFFREGRCDGVLLVIAEISERLAREREEAEQGELMQGFKKMMLDRNGFAIFLREAGQMVEAICTRRLDDDQAVLKRTIHTLKGNSASMGLAVVARLCHSLEEQLAEGEPTSDKTLAELFGRWTAMTEHIASFGGSFNQRVIEIPEPEYHHLVSRLSDQAQTDPELLDQILRWQMEPVARPLKRLAEQAKQLAQRLQKPELRVELEPNDVRLDPHTWSPFFSELIHVIRNAVDHGIERASEREAAGKPRVGTLCLRASVVGPVLCFEISDDGRGIDWDAIGKKAAELGLPHETQAELFDALCADGVTTRREVSGASGRGVGMAAVRQRVSAMGGRLEVRSVRGVGTSWLLRFPWAPHACPPPSTRRVDLEVLGRIGVSTRTRAGSAVR